MGRLMDSTKVYVPIVIDSYSSQVFCLLSPNSNPEGAGNLLENITIPFFRDQGLHDVETNSGRRNTFERKSTYVKYVEHHRIY